MRRVLVAVLLAVRRRAEALTAGCHRYQIRARKGPADKGPAGPLDVSTIRFCFLPLHRNYLEVLQGH